NEPICELTFCGNLAAAGIPSEDYTLIKKLSTDELAISAAHQVQYDLLIIDGDHSYEGVKQDFENYLTCVKSGGYIIFDDYDAPEWPGVSQFVDEVRSHQAVSFVGAGMRTAIFKVG